MREAIRSIVQSGRRAELVLGVITYAHSGWLSEAFLRRGLRSLGTDYVDELILGYFSRRPPRRVLDSAQRLKESGMVRSLGITSHRRSLFPELLGEGRIDVFHVRYNAVHRGAEQEVFPSVAAADHPPGVAVFTATSWGKLLNPKRMPPGERTPSATECYRFVLSHPIVDLCMSGPRTLAQMRENLAVLDSGPMSEEELARMRRIGDHLYGRPRV
jgi:predicted aldo/keto reductase-like oxidoreductase